MFSGWPDGTTIYQPGDTFTMPEFDITLTAMWTEEIETPPSSNSIHKENWVSYNEEFAEKYITRSSELVEIINQIKHETDERTPTRIEALLTESSYRPLIGSISWPYPNGGRQGSSVYDSGLGTTVNWGKTNQGCVAYSFFASQYIFNSTGQALDIQEAIELNGDSPTSDELERFIETYADPGEHIRFYRNGGGRVHSIVYLTHDSDGIYFLSYPSRTTAVDILYCSYSKLANALRVDYSDGKGNRTLWLYDVQNNSRAIDLIEISGECPIEMIVSYQGETLSSIGLDGEQTASFGVMSASGAKNDRTINLSLDFQTDYEVTILGTGTGTVDFNIEFLDSEREVVDFRTYLGISVNSTTEIIASDFDPNDEILLLVDNDSNSIIDSGWCARTNESVTSPQPDIITQIYGTIDDEPTPDVDDDDDEGNSSGTDSNSSSERRYAIDLDVGRGGGVSLSADRASAGTRITITVDPDAGYELDELTVLDEDGDALTLTQRTNSTYTFHMPTGPVTVEASFIRSQAETAGLPFADVASNTWYYDAVEYMYENGLMSGVSDGWFSPDAALTRAQLVQILYALEGRPAVSNSSGFTDVTSADWFADAVGWAAANGVVSGVSAGTFAPNDPLTREQLALILYRYAQYKSYDTTQGGMAVREFSDYSTISSWALEAMDWAVNAGLLSGTGNGMLSPAGTATRAQVAQILMNFCETVAC